MTLSPFNTAITTTQKSPKRGLSASLIGLLSMLTLSTLLFSQHISSSAAQSEYTIRGVVSSTTGTMIANAKVAFTSGSSSTKTDKTGRFILKADRSGTHILQVSAKGYKTKTKSINVTSAFTDVLISLSTTNAQRSPPAAEAEDVAVAKPIRALAADEPPSPASSSVGLSGAGRVASARRAMPKKSVRRGKGKRSRRNKVSRSRAKSSSHRRPRRRRPSKPIHIATSHSLKDSESAQGDEYKKIDDNDFKDPKAEPLSTFSIDVDTASYANLRRFIQNGQRPPIDSVKIEEMINYFDYSYEGPSDSNKHPFSVKTELAEAPWNPRHKLMHIGLQGRKIDADKLPPSNLVFLLDVSGSMNGPDRLPLLKQALMLLSGTLRAQDKVSIVVYAGSSGLVLPPTSGAERRKIIEAFSKLRAGGSTAGGAGINLAYKIAQEQFIKGGNNRVILATDGDFNVGTRSQSALVRLIEKKRKSGVFLTVLGFGRGNYRASTMSELAEKGNGNHAYIDSILEAQKVLVSEMGGTLFTIAKDVKIQVEFNPAYVGRYRLLGYQSRILAAADFNNDKKDAGELGAGHSVTALYEIIPPDEVKAGEGSVDALKYQQKAQTTAPRSAKRDEWLTVKLRYKKPDGDKSTLMTHPHRGDGGDWREASEDFRFSAGVASFGMLLRDSKYLGESSKGDKWSMVKEVIKGAAGSDSQGYRAELIDLVNRAQKLSK